jgi:hypothetical protein
MKFAKPTSMDNFSATKATPPLSMTGSRVGTLRRCTTGTNTFNGMHNSLFTPSLNLSPHFVCIQQQANGELF